MSTAISRPRVPVRALLAIIAAALGAWIAWQAHVLVLPCLVACLLALACRPAVMSMHERGVPRIAAVALLGLAAAALLAGAVSAIRAVAPSPEDITQVKLRARHALALHYSSSIPHALRREAAPLAAKADRWLALTPGEEAILEGRAARDARWETLRRQRDGDASLLGSVLPSSAAVAPAQAASGPADDEVAVALRPIARGLPIAATAFLLFVFVLADDGSLKRGVFRGIPNRLFEPALAVTADLHRVMRRYALALFAQCVLLGATVAATLAIAGVAPRWAGVIGFFAGMVNFVPYAGIGTALAGGLAYVALGGEVHSPLAFLEVANGVLAVVGAVVVTDVAKNALIDPLLMGRALMLHPVAVILAIAAGAEAFGFAGALLATPAVAVAGAFAASVLRQLRAYERPPG